MKKLAQFLYRVLLRKYIEGAVSNTENEADDKFLEICDRIFNYEEKK